MQKLNSQLLIGFMIITFGLACQTTPLEFTSTVVPSETASPSETTTLAPLPAATPRPVSYPEIPDGFTAVDYFASWYGVYFALPEKWSIIDYSFQLEVEAAILLRNREGGEIYLYPHSIAQFGTTDPAEILSTRLLSESKILNNHFWWNTSSKDHDFNFSVLRDPELGIVNGQNTASIILEVSYKNEDDETLFTETIVTVIVNGTEALLIIGHPSEDFETFSRTMQQIGETVVLQPRTGPILWHPGTIFKDSLKYHFFQPNLYSIQTQAGQTLLFVASCEGNSKPGITVYDATQIDSPVIFKRGSQDRLIVSIAGASARFNKTDVALIFDSVVSRKHIIGVEGCFMSTIFFWSLSSDENIRLLETSVIPAGGQQAWEFNAEAGQGVPFIIIHDGSAELRFEIRDSEGKRLNFLPLQSEKGQPIGFVFTSDVDGTFILRALNQGESDGAYAVIIGDIDS